MAPKYKIILSDLHLGFGPHNSDGSYNIFEEFHYDKTFVEFLNYYCEGEYAKAEVELILNGDILNHIYTTPEDPHCDMLTEQIALERTEAILNGHPIFFQALSKFAKRPSRKIIYLMGNHDVGVAWPKVQQRLKEKIDPNLKFFLDHYESDGVWVEHGNRFLIDNRVDLDNLFLTRGHHEAILKMPWGNFFVIHFLNPLKKERAYIGKVFPFKMYLRWALTHDTRFALKTIGRLILYFLMINFIRDPKRNFSLFDTWKIVREFLFPVPIDKDVQEILKEHPSVKVVSCGHTHHALFRQFEKGGEYINTGSWNEMIGLDLGSLGRQLRLTFAEVVINEKGIFGKLKEWKGSHQVVEEGL